MNHILYVFCFNVSLKSFCHTLWFNFTSNPVHGQGVDLALIRVLHLFILHVNRISSSIWLLLLINGEHIRFLAINFVTWRIMSFYFISCHTRVVALYTKDCLPTKSAFDWVFQFNDWIQRNAIWHNQWR